MTLIISDGGRVDESSAPRSSIDAFANAIDAGVPGIKIAVRPCADGELILWDGTTVNDVPVEQLTRFQIEQHTGVLPDLLDDVLALVDENDTRLDIEIKDGDPQVALDVFEQVDAWALPREKFIITSFNDGIVAMVKEIKPTVRAGLILGRALEDLPDRLAGRFKVLASEFFPARRLRRCRADYVVPCLELVLLGVLSRSRHLPALVWTVNEDEDILSMLEHSQVEGLITDRPLRAVALDKERPAA